MSVYDKLLKFKNENDNFSYTFIIYDISTEEFVNQLKKKIDNLNKKINNSFKKKNINDRLFSFITYIESNYTPNFNINSIFLVNKKVYNLQFTKNDLQFCKKWNINKFYMNYDFTFQIEYLIRLFSTNSTKTIFKFDKTNYEIIELDSTKSRIVENHKNMDIQEINNFISNYKPTVIYGNNIILKKLDSQKNTIIFENMNYEKILELISNKEIEENQEKFKKEFLDNLTNPSEMDKLIYGKKEVGLSIENFQIKKLFINPKLLKILKEKADPSMLNFEIVMIKSQKKGDLGTILNKDYGGMVGIKYY